MIGMHTKYLGALRCESVHLKSGVQVITDAPPDNNGKGEAFSPTDLLSTSLAACMITIMGITAESKSIAMGQVEADIEKYMGSDPRRVIGINITIRLSGSHLSEKDRTILENAAKHCPVAKSLHPEINQNVTFQYV